MKKLILILAIASVSFVNAQKISTSVVPVAVTSKFTSLYPDYKGEEWKKEKGNYEAKITQNTTKTYVVIDPSGNLVKTTTDIAVSELPAAVNDYVTKNYMEQKITEASKTIEADGKIKYEAKVKENRLCFDADGKYIKAEKRKS